MKTLILVAPTENQNGIKVIKSNHNVNSVDLRKVSIKGRDNGYIASVAGSTGNIIVSGFSWRPKVVKSPVENLQEIVDQNIEKIKDIINQ